MIEFRRGDVFLTRGNSFVSKAIRWFSRSTGESRTMVNHCGVVVSDGTVDESEIIEALTTVKRRRFSVYSRSKSTQVAVYRATNASPEQLDTIVSRALSYEHRKYGYAKLAAHALDRLLGGVYLFRRVASVDWYPICSWVVASSYADAGFNFGVPAGAADPDDIWDFVSTSDHYEVVYPLGELQ